MSATNTTERHSDFLLRSAHAADVPALARLWLLLMKEHERFHLSLEITPDAEEVAAARYVEFLSVGDGRIFVAESGGRVVGMLVCEIRRAGNTALHPAYGYLKDASVEKAFQNRGIGTLLVEAALDYCRQAGVPYIDALTAADNEQSNRFWEKMGFRPTRIIRSMPLPH